MADTKNQDEQVGSAAGMWAGILTGARLGTVILPIPVVGTFAGMLVGGVLGSEVGKNVGGALLNSARAFGDSIQQAGSNMSGGSTVESSTVPKDQLTK
jgi:phage tail tape-measure protein